MDPVLLQKQVRDNAEDLRSYLQDLKSWESEMKRKESEIHSTGSGSQDHPPVRSKIKKLSKGKEKSENKKEKSEKISGSDYASWDKFDVDKACEELDSEEQKNSEDEDSLSEIEVERRREEALYEKEKGNDFVRLQQWKEAIECYSRAIKCYPHDAIFYANRALCYLKTQELKSAETDSTTALQLDSNYVKAYQRRAMARSGLGQFAEARADLLRVMEIEPKNTVSRAELSKIEKKLNLKPEQITVNPSLPSTSSKADTESAETSTVKISAKSKELIKATDRPKGPVEKKLQDSPKEVSSSSNLKNSTEIELQKQAKCTVNSGILELQNVDSKLKERNIQELELWPCEEDVMLVQPIQKPPHLRSKKPLKRIPVKEVDNLSMSHSIIQEISSSEVPENEDKRDQEKSSLTVEKQRENESLRCVDAKNETNEVKSTSKTQQVVECAASTTINLQPETDIVNEIPPTPSTSVQFYVGWKKVRSKPELGYLYLKQIPGSEIPNLFRDSLESSTFSDIITTIEKTFLQYKEPVLPYIIGLTKVRRFAALVMFLTAADKAGIRKILEYCKEQGECSQDDFKDLKKKYEV